MPEGNGFEPPKYISALIATINDGGKSVQASAIALTVVGLYLVATAFAATDEDLLLGHTTPVAQLGIQLPIVFSFAIAPIIFVLLHLYLLLRYGMVRANIWQLLDDLPSAAPVSADRERILQLLANVEFVLADAVPPSSKLHNWLYRGAVWIMAAAAPLLALLLVQISALRMQDELISGIQRVLFAVDLLSVLLFFLVRRDLGFGARLLRGLVGATLFYFLMAANTDYLSVPDPDETGVRREGNPSWEGFLDAPLDVLCANVHWGCRFLDVSHRPLFGRVWDNHTLVELREGKFREDASAALEGAVLKGRSLRFANLAESDLMGADLRDADLRKANLSSTRLQEADMSHADLAEVDLEFAYLQGARLFRASAQAANFSTAHMRGAELDEANLTAALFSYADLQGASLKDARLWGAELVGAQLTGADLRGAQLQLAGLAGAQMIGTQLACSIPFGAHFQGAMVLGGDLSPEQRAVINSTLQTKPRCAKIWHVLVNGLTNFALANFAGADFETQLTDQEKIVLMVEAVGRLPLAPEDKMKLLRARYGVRLDDTSPLSVAPGFRSAPGPALVDDPIPKPLADVAPEALVTDARQYWLALSNWALTTPFPQNDPPIAQRIAEVFVNEVREKQRAHEEIESPFVETACRFYGVARTQAIKLSERDIEALRGVAGPCQAQSTPR
jgi:uncharacterized protein YjbI with pentapeptide repeats